MNLKEITLEGFGLFDKKFTAKLDEHKLNIILGPNESGKSTLLKGITATIFGLKKSDWESLKSWGKSKNGTGKVVFEIDKIEYAIEREFESNHITFTKKEPGNNVTKLFEGNVSPQSRTDDKELYLSCLKEILGINNEDVFYNANVVKQRSIETKIDAELQQIITGAIGTNYKNVLEEWREKYFDYTKKSIWEGVKDKRNDGKIELIDKQLKELEEKNEKLIESSVQSSELAEKLAGKEKQKTEKEDELKKLRTNFENAKKYTDLIEKYNILKTRKREISEEVVRIKEIKKEIEEKENFLKENFNAYDKITDDVLDNYKLLKNLELEMIGKENELKELKSKSISSFPKKIILGINVFILAGLTFLIGMKFESSFLFIISGAMGFLALFFIAYSIVKQAKVKFKNNTMINLIQNNLEEKKQKINIINNNLSEHKRLLLAEDFENKIMEYRKRKNELENLKYTLQRMRAEDELNKSYDDIENALLLVLKMLQELEEKNPFLSAFKENLNEGIEYVSQLELDIEKLENEKNDIERDIFELRKKLSSSYTDTESIESLEDKIEELEAELKEMRLQKDAYAESVNTLKEAILEYQKRHKERLSKNISEIFSKITHARYIDVQLTDEFEPEIKFKDSKIIKIDSLSCGAEEQLYFAMRLALIRELNNVTNLPLILDDPFVNFDSERLKVVRNTLYSIVHQNQVILFTHIQSYSGWDNINLISL